MAAASPTNCDLLIHNGLLLTADRRNPIVEGGALAIRGTSIAAMGASRDLCRQFTARETIDAAGAIVHPGFIDAHIHISQYTARSVLPRMEGTAITMGDWKGALRPEDEQASAMLAAVDYFRCGYTAFVDPGTIFEPDAVAEVAEKTGIRIWMTDPYVADLGHVLGEHNPDLVSPSFLARWPRSTDEAVARMGQQLRRNNDREGLVHAFIGIYGDGTCSAELLHAAVAQARRNKVQFQEHRGYNPKSLHEREAASGVSEVASLEKDGVLGPEITFVHMNVVHKADVPRLAQSGTRIVWCPYSQLRMLGLGGAEPRMLELARAGTPIALATDIPRTLNFDALGTLATGNAVACGTVAKPEEIFRMRTIDAAASVGAADRVGSLEVGKQADVVVRSPQASESLGADRFWEIAVLGLTTPPAFVIVNGAVVARDGLPARIDAGEVAANADRSVKDLLKRIAL